MRDGAYIKRLSADLERWRTSGAVSAEQASALLADAHERAAISKTNPAAIAAALGAILFGLGLITFVAANWDYIPRSVQMIAALALIWITFGGAVAALERNIVWLGHAFALVGALAVGASVALVGLIYHIEGTPAGLFFLWMLGAGAAAICFRSTPVLILYVILAASWYVLDRPGEVLGFVGDDYTASWKDFGFQYLPFWALGAFLGRRWDSGAAMHMSGLALLVWVLAVFGDAVWWGERPDWLIAGVLAAAAGAGVAVGGEYVRHRLGERAGQIALAWGAAIVLAGLIIAQIALHEDHGKALAPQMVFAAAALALCTWAIAWADAPGRRGARGIAIAGFAFECFYIYVVLFGGLMNSALFLLGGGALLFALAFGLHRITRKKEPSPAELAP